MEEAPGTLTLKHVPSESDLPATSESRRELVSNAADDATPAKSSGPEDVSIFDIRERGQKMFILIVAAIIGFVVPLTDNIYLPALASVTKSVPGANKDLVMATMASYMAAVGIGFLLWGPLSDMVGRKAPIILCLLPFLGFVLGCIFAQDINSLIVLRALQGLAVGATAVCPGAMIADVFKPAERGMAMGFFMIPVLFGPILAPLIGGGITKAMDYRATFIFLAALTFVILALALSLPETVHWQVLRKRQQHNEKALEDGSDVLPRLREEGTIHKPGMRPPWAPLAIMLEAPIRPYVCSHICNFGAMFVVLTVFPIAMAAAPYSLSEDLIGVGYLPIGLLNIVGSVIGGALTDRAAAKDRSRPTARLLPNILATLFLVPAGCLIFGLALHFQLHLAVVLLGQALTGAGMCVFGPALSAYVTTLKQQQASTANAGSMCLQFVLAAILMQIAVPLQQALTTAGLFGLVAGITLASSSWALADYAMRARRPPMAAAAGEQQVHGHASPTVGQT